MLAGVQLVGDGKMVDAVVTTPAADTTHPDEAASLTSRELEVLGLLAEGAPNKDISRRLSISVHTAKFHVGSLLDKLDTSDAPMLSRMQPAWGDRPIMLSNEGIVARFPRVGLDDTRLLWLVSNRAPGMACFPAERLRSRNRKCDPMSVRGCCFGSSCSPYRRMRRCLHTRSARQPYTRAK